MNVSSGERGGRKPEPARPEAPNPESGAEASQVPAEEAAAAGKPNGSGEKRDPAEAAGKTQRAGQPEEEPALSAGAEPAGSAPEAASAAPAGRAAWSTAPGAAAAPGAPTLAELQDRWLRAEADLRNLRRRAAIEREEARRSAEDGVLLEMIAMLDDLDRALEAAREAGAPESWTEGVRLTADRVRERLARYGVVTLDPAGKPFDPHFHEALLEVEAPKGVRPGVVVQVVHAGYARGERALRPARVVVARAPAEGTGH
jgi:molecular chaperone GrpE